MADSEEVVAPDAAEPVAPADIAQVDKLYDITLPLRLPLLFSCCNNAF